VLWRKPPGQGCNVVLPSEREDGRALDDPTPDEIEEFMRLHREKHLRERAEENAGRSYRHGEGPVVRQFPDTLFEET